MLMKLVRLLVVAFLGTVSHAAFAEDQCDIGGASRHIPLPRAVNFNGVLERRVETPVCWSIRQNDGSTTQMVFFRSPREGQNPGPTVILRWSCKDNKCQIVGSMDFKIQTFRQEDLHYRIYGYGYGNGNRVFSLDSGDIHIDCNNDGQHTVYLIVDPQQPNRDAMSTRQTFEAATDIVVHLDRNDKSEGLCSQPKHSVLQNLADTAAKAFADTVDNISGRYNDSSPKSPSVSSATGSPTRLTLASWGPYGPYQCASPAGPDAAPRSASCFSGLGASTWLVCTGRDTRS
jgi:hypothetical protein